MTDWTLQNQNPFGLLVTAKHDAADLRTVPIAILKQWVAADRLVTLRNFAALVGPELPKFCAGLGKILEWEFGAVNDLQVKPGTRNYLYTNREVPFHWDGAFVGTVPHYIFFHCDVAPLPAHGGETLFCDTSLLLAAAPAERQEQWQRVTITYTTEKIVHYGGKFSSPMICSHPISGDKTVRFAEPVADLNPVQLEIEGIPPAEQPEFLEDMHARLHDVAACYAHAWQSGDVVIADNHMLLHGRKAFLADAERSIRRVNIL
jgi:alpha-ketoglutarate-dependent taurine dioxygenase